MALINCNTGEQLQDKIRQNKVNEKDRAKLIWDFYNQSDKHILANQPDVVVVDKKSKRATITDLAISDDYNKASRKKVKDKEVSHLKEIEKCWHIGTAVILVDIRAIDTITPAHQMWCAPNTDNNQHNSVAKKHTHWE